MKYVEKIKEKKKYFLIGLIILFIGTFLLIKNLRPQIDNSKLFADEESLHLNTKEKSGVKVPDEKRRTKKSSRITVDLFGAVINEGVYKLAANSRLNDLLNLAGGVDSKADLKAINRAMILEDGIKIYVPYKGDNAPNIGISSNEISTDNGQISSDVTDKININQASIIELQELSGIGEKKAELIINYREENGPFKDPKDLTKVSGIGVKTYENLADQVTI